MGAALELGKLPAVAYLGRSYGALPLRLALVGALMALNSIGAYGLPSRAQIAHADQD